MTITTTELVREIKRRNPEATMVDIGRVCGLSKQAVHQHLRKLTQKPARKPAIADDKPFNEGRYRSMVEQIPKVIKERGCIWEGARLHFEAGAYEDAYITRLLGDGIIVPSSDPSGGYVLP